MLDIRCSMCSLYSAPPNLIRELKLLCFMSFDQLVRLLPFRTSDFLQFHSHSSSLVRSIHSLVGREYVIHIDRIGRNLLFLLSFHRFIRFHSFVFTLFRFRYSSTANYYDSRYMYTRYMSAVVTTATMMVTPNGNTCNRRRNGSPNKKKENERKAHGTSNHVSKDVRHKTEEKENDWPSLVLPSRIRL